jgi:type VI secretion system secreted protein VgrG
MTMRTFSMSVLVLVFSLLAVSAYAETAQIGSASIYGAMGYAGVTNTDTSTVVYGYVGGGAGSPSVTGFYSPGITVPANLILTGTPGNFLDAQTAYNYGSGLAPTEILTGQDLGGLTLTPGVYKFAAAAQLTGTLTLDAQGNSNAQWIFVIGSLLTTASASSIKVIDAGSSSSLFGGGITWDAYSGATLGTTTTFLGTIISDTGGVVLETGATIGCGRAISLGASVTLDSNVIDTPPDCMVTTTGSSAHGTGAPIASAAIVTPEPGTFGLFGAGLGLLLISSFRRSKLSALRAA